MKTTRTLALYMGLFITIAFISCQKNDLSSSATTEDATRRSGIVLVTDPAPVEPPDCSTTCITSEGPYIEVSHQEAQTWGSTSRPHSKSVDHVVYNTGTSFVVKVTFTHSGGNASNEVSVTAFGTTQSIETLASGAMHTFTFDLPAGWQACDNVPYSIYQEGQNSPMELSYSYNLYAVCPAACETSFEGEAMECGTQREAEYTFVSTDELGYFKIQGGLTNFTGADASIEVIGGTGVVKDQWTPGGSTNRVIKVEGSASVCETIAIRITWTSTNSGGIITGQWSVKDAAGVEIAPAVAGLTCD